MLTLLLELLVVCCQLYILVWVISFIFGIFGVYRTPFYPVGPYIPSSLGSLILAIAIVIVFGHYSPIHLGSLN